MLLRQFSGIAITCDLEQYISLFHITYLFKFCEKKNHNFSVNKIKILDIRNFSNQYLNHKSKNETNEDLKKLTSKCKMFFLTTSHYIYFIKIQYVPN